MTSESTICVDPVDTRYISLFRQKDNHTSSLTQENRRPLC